MTGLLALPALSNQSRLATLGATVRAELAAIERPASEVLTIAIAIGAALYQAKTLAGHGNWENWLVTETGLSLRSARDYLLLHANRAQIEANRQRAADLRELSIRGALRLIRTGTSARKRTTASSLKITDWRGASLEERTKFVAGIPLTDWLAAVPAALYAEIIDRIDGQRASLAKQVVTQTVTKKVTKSALKRAA